MQKKKKIVVLMAGINKTALLILPEHIHLGKSAVSGSQLALPRMTCNSAPCLNLQQASAATLSRQRQKWNSKPVQLCFKLLFVGVLLHLY